MKLLDELRKTADQLESAFQAQLMREDIARIEQLVELARTAATYEDYERAGLYLEWTQGDLRTFELTADLKPFLEAVHATANTAATDATDRQIRDTWITFNTARMNKLIGCL